MTDIREFLKKEKVEIDEVIEKFFPRSFEKEYIEFLVGKATYEHTHEILTKSIAQPVWDFLDRGGKRWRPALFLLLVEALGGSKEEVKDFSLLLELLHNGSIIVDDIEDNSDLRRGKPALHKIYGVDVAINAGNFLYFLPLIVPIKMRDKMGEKTLARLYEAYAEEMIKIHLGQGADIGWHKGLIDPSKISEQQYLQMCAYKTGVLSRLAARLAVILTNKSKDIEEKLGHFGETIGVAFQIQDDILNLRPSKEWGKDRGDDISEGKITLIVLHTLRNADENDRERLLEILSMHTKDQKLIEEAIEIMEKYGSLEYAKGFARKIVKEAWALVEPLLEESEAKQTLRSFVSFMVKRDI